MSSTRRSIALLTRARCSHLGALPVLPFVLVLAIFSLLLTSAGSAFAADAASKNPGPLRVLIITGGHEFDQDAFFAMFNRMTGITWSHAAYGGEAEQRLAPERSSEYDALLFYDMNQQVGPHVRNIESILAQGKPVVFLHHAIGSYPEWTEFQQLAGGHANFGGRVIPGVNNTKFLHDVWMHVKIAAPEHPILSGLRDFDIYDEAYKNAGISPNGQVLLRTDFNDSDEAIAWTHRYKKSQVVYVQLGHGPQAFSHPVFETLVARSLQWVAGRL